LLLGANCVYYGLKCCIFVKVGNFFLTGRKKENAKGAVVKIEDYYLKRKHQVFVKLPSTFP
jgi:hypothetical protein